VRQREEEENGKARKEMSSAGGAGTMPFPRPHNLNALVGQHPPLQWLLHHCRSPQYNFPNPSTHPDFSFLPLPDSSSDQNILAGDGVAFILELNAKYKARFPECLAQVMTQLGSDDIIACIIHDEFMYFSQQTAKDLKIPSIVLRTASATTWIQTMGTPCS
jgi:hypothetical protein